MGSLDSLKGHCSFDQLGHILYSNAGDFHFGVVGVKYISGLGLKDYSPFKATQTMTDISIVHKHSVLYAHVYYRC